MIINLTQHKATPDQIKAGVVDLPEGYRDALVSFLTFEELPTPKTIEYKADCLRALVDSFCEDLAEVQGVPMRDLPSEVMIGGAPYLMPTLVRLLCEEGYRPLFAFTKRESVEKTMPDGTVVKTNVFRHAGFVEAV